MTDHTTHRAIHNNPSRYPEPDTFKSSRYLGKDLSAAEYINSNDPYERDHFAYGAGRFVPPFLFRNVHFY